MQTQGAAYFAEDVFAKWLGVELMQEGAGRAQLSLTVQPSHRNGLGGVHGAVIFALADIAFAIACNSRGHRAVGIEAHIHYLKGAVGGEIQATASEINAGGRLSHYEVDIHEPDGRLLARFSGMAYRVGV